MFRILIISLLALFFGSCVTRERCYRKYPPVSETKYVTEIKEVLKDTTITLPADSSWLKALIECDSVGNAYIKQIIDYKTGKYSVVRTVLKDNIIYTDCKVDSQKVYLTWKEKHSNTSEVTVLTITKETNKITGWQWFQVWLGRVFFSGWILYFIYSFIKRKFSI